jgi:hypothetical protein
MATKKFVQPWELRKQRGETQAVFWGRIAVSQTGGCRYEQGREMHPAVRMLYGIVYLGEPTPKAPKARA